MTELNNIDCENQCITWLDEENNIDEVKFCEAYLQQYDLKCINGSFFSIDGFVSDGEIEKNIYNQEQICYGIKVIQEKTVYFRCRRVTYFTKILHRISRKFP